MVIETGQLLEKTDEELRAEITKLRGVMDALHLKHKELTAERAATRDNRAKDQSEIKRLAGV